MPNNRIVNAIESIQKDSRIEYITRKTFNDKKENEIKKAQDDNVESINKEIRMLAEKVVTILTGISSSVLSAIIVAIINDNFKGKNMYIWMGIISILTVLIVWFLFSKYIIPNISKIVKKELPSISNEKKNISIKRFNYEIIPKLLEVNEIIYFLEKEKPINEYKILNIVVSLYKLQEIVDFIHDKLTCTSDEIVIRKSQEDGATALLRYSYNSYAIFAVIQMLSNIQNKMKKMLNEIKIMNINGYELLKNDFEVISERINEIRCKVTD